MNIASLMDDLNLSAHRRISRFLMHLRGLRLLSGRRPIRFAARVLLLLVGTVAIRAASEAPRWLAAPAPVSGTTTVFTVDPARAQILAAPNPVSRFAAGELHKHLALITGTDVPVASRPNASRSGEARSDGIGPKHESGGFVFYVGIPGPEETGPLQPEEARWRVTPRAAFLYGDDAIAAPQGTEFDTVMRYDNHTGTLFAVYEFLERQLGVRWIAPGDANIAYEKRTALVLTPESDHWLPALNQRHIRSCYRDIGDGDPDGIEVRPLVLAHGDIPYAYILGTPEFLRRRADELLWHRRMRMGRGTPIVYGHAFTDWWRLFGKTHPEYFALNRFGQRAPSPDIMQGMPERIKLCVSNPDVVLEVVRRHFANGGGPVVNACENDSRGYCRCPNCLALDVLLPGEETTDIDRRHLTDRYLHFANAVEAEARRYNPQAKTAFYAYSQQHFPPRREKVAPGVIVFFITGQFTSDEELAAEYDAWKQAGANEVYLRPNHLCDDTGMPLGFEQGMFDKFELIRRHYPLAGTDYDCSWGFRPISGIAEYVIARAFYAPNESFAHWEDEYCATFGPAAEDIRAYYRYWRQVWNQRVMPNRARINRVAGQIKEIRDKLMQVTDLLYAEEDFDRTDALLATAAGRSLTPALRWRVAQVQLANQHSRLTYRARKANELASTATTAEKNAATRTLHDFRREHRDDLDLYWEGMFWLENAYNDAAGTLRMAGRQGKRYADWAEQMAESIREARLPDEPPLR